jgi:hypothetical protein
LLFTTFNITFANYIICPERPPVSVSARAEISMAESEVMAVN